MSVIKTNVDLDIKDSCCHFRIQVYIVCVAIYNITGLAWNELKALPRAKLVAILPVGSLEAHGPHLPLSADTIISSEMARLTAEKLSTNGFSVLILPALDYTIADFAKSFDGTFTMKQGLFEDLLKSIYENLVRIKLKYLLVANSHLDPNHLKALHNAFDSYTGLKAIFIDKTKAKFVQHLTDEFKSGSCHAGQYETSLVLAVRPDLVKDEYKKLKPNVVSLAQKIKEGAESFEAVGMKDAYCGDPSKATAEEGRKTYNVLSDMLVGAFMEEYGKSL